MCIYSSGPERDRTDGLNVDNSYRHGFKICHVVLSFFEHFHVRLVVAGIDAGPLDLVPCYSSGAYAKEKLTVFHLLDLIEEVKQFFLFSGDERLFSWWWIL